MTVAKNNVKPYISYIDNKGMSCLRCEYLARCSWTGGYPCKRDAFIDMETLIEQENIHSSINILMRSDDAYEPLITRHVGFDKIVQEIKEKMIFLWKKLLLWCIKMKFKWSKTKKKLMEWFRKNKKMNKFIDAMFYTTIGCLITALVYHAVSL